MLQIASRLIPTPRFIAVIAFVCTALVLSACAESNSDSAIAGDKNNALSAVATTGMVADVVRAIAGDRANVVNLMNAGIDPHLYAPTRSDVTRMLGADIIFYNGLHLEGKMAESFDRASSAGTPVYAVGELIEGSENVDHNDPHIWMDPALWMQTIEVVQEALSEFDPDNASAYSTNARAYRESVEEIDTYAAGVLESVPGGQRVLITAHDAFNYFGNRYGYEVIGIQGISTESEAGIRDIERLVQLITDRNVGAVFVESTVSDRTVRRLVDGCAAKGHAVIIGGELYSDAMGAGGTYEGTYIGMIDHNVTTIARALGGDAPERGFQGRLSQ